MVEGWKYYRRGDPLSRYGAAPVYTFVAPKPCSIYGAVTVYDPVYKTNTGWGYPEHSWPHSLCYVAYRCNL